MPSRPFRRAAAAVHGFYWRSGIADDVPALAFYVVASVIPFAIGAAAVAAIASGEAEVRRLAAEVASYLPADARYSVIKSAVEAKRSSPGVLAASILAAMWLTSGAAGVVERCLARLSGSRRHGMLAGRARNVALGALLLAAASAGVQAGAAASGLLSQAGVPGGALRAGAEAFSLLGAWLLCAAVYALCTADRIPVRAALIGAVPAAVILQAAPLLVGAWLAAGKIAGAGRIAGTAAVTLAGCYALAAGLLVGAGAAAAAARRMRSRGQQA